MGILGSMGTGSVWSVKPPPLGFKQYCPTSLTVVVTSVVWKPMAFPNAAPVLPPQFHLPHIHPCLSFRCGSHSLACPGTGTCHCVCSQPAHKTTTPFPIWPCSVKWDLPWYYLDEGGFFPYFVSCQSNRDGCVGSILSGKRVSSCSEMVHFPFCSTLCLLWGPDCPGMSFGSFSSGRWKWCMVAGKLKTRWLEPGDMGPSPSPSLPILQQDPGYSTSLGIYFLICGMKDWAR